MAGARKGLGRGLSALIPDSDMDFLSRVARGEAAVVPVTPPPGAEQPIARVDALAESTQSLNTPDDTRPDAREAAIPTEFSSKAVSEATPIWVEIERVETNPYQPRRLFSPEEMQELVESVRTHGILQPILIRPLDSTDGVLRYQLVAGERRWRAAQAVGLTHVPAIVRSVNDQQALELALIENIQRHDISPVDAARAYKRLATEFGLSQEQVAARVGKSRSAIANTLRLLDLPEEIQKAIEDGILSEGHGRAILLAEGEGARRAVFRRILRDGLSVRETEQSARQASREGPTTVNGHDRSPGESSASGNASELRDVEQSMQKILGTRVHIRPRAKGGRIIIDYFSEQDLNRLITLLRPHES
ncbi:MAG: ParB/RepB/Spo0J family partition protein [Armatimonadota bacterium]|nr:ParB/RepB/Spo0J family partition protein [Armatimonadota bacterium]